LDDWRQTTLGDESTLVTSGSRGWAKYYSDDGPLFIRAQNIKTDALVLDVPAHVRPPAGSEGARTQVFENDLLITITGANVTKSARVEAPLGKAYFSQRVALVRPSSPAHAPFLYY
jgi:type I restriction enzyme S subunit